MSLAVMLHCLSLTTAFLATLPFTVLSGTIPTVATTATTETMSSVLDDIEQQCNEMMGKAVQARRLKVDLKSDLSIMVQLTQGVELFVSHFIFPIESPETAPKIHRRVFGTLTRMVGRREASRVVGLYVEIPKGVDGCNDTRTAEMATFLQSIADSSTIQEMGITVNVYATSNDRAMETHHNDTTKPTDDIRLVTAVAANLALPQSMLKKVHIERVHFDNELLHTLCEPLSTSQCRLVELKFNECHFPTLEPLWSALAANQSIQTLWVEHPVCGVAPATNVYATQKLQSMLESNTTMTELAINGGNPPFPNSFFAALGTGVASNTTLAILDLSFIINSEKDYLNVLFEGGVDRNVDLEKLCLDVTDLSATQDLVSGLDKMAKNISTKRSVDGSHGVSTLKHLGARFEEDLNEVECVKTLLDCLVRNSVYFALEELHLECGDDEEDDDDVCDGSLFDNIAAFIQAFPTVAVLKMSIGSGSIDDSNLTALSGMLEKNTTMTEFEIGDLGVTTDLEERNEWNPLDNTNHTGIVCFVFRNRRELPMFVESSKRSLLPLVLRRLLKPRRCTLENVVNLTHAFHLTRNLPELFSTDERCDGGGAKVESIEN